MREIGVPINSDKLPTNQPLLYFNELGLGVGKGVVTMTKIRIFAPEPSTTVELGTP